MLSVVIVGTFFVRLLQISLYNGVIYIARDAVVSQ